MASVTMGFCGILATWKKPRHILPHPRRGAPVLLAQTLRNAQAVRDAAPAKLAVLRASVRKGHCALWTPA